MDGVDVFFQQVHQRVTVQAGTLLSDACRMAGIPLELVCGGGGTCGKCRVLIRQEDRLESVLACRTRVSASVTVILPEEAPARRTDPGRVGADGAPDLQPERFHPAVKKRYVEKASLTGREETTFLDEHLHSTEAEGFTLVTDRGRIIDVQAGDTTGLLYGAAVDIGTTTLVVYLYDLCTGNLLGVCAGRNPQAAAGADVISRIQYCNSHEHGTRELQQAVISAINALLAQAGEAVPGLADHLYHLTACGNTTMQHLFLGYHPRHLGLSPFRSLHDEAVESRGMDLGLLCAEQARVTFLPLLGGFVGADTTAALLTVRQDQQQRLMIDLGTNGEIAVGSGNRYRVASTACGPAFEGAGLSCGMRAAAGAVEGCELTGGALVLRVKGDRPAQGICGSGIVDLLAVLLQNEMIEPSGRLLDRSTFRKLHPSRPLAERLVTVEDQPAFMVAAPEISGNSRGVYVTQKDIRQVQLAKSAIYTGCLLLLEKQGLKGEELDEILLAGAFGTYIHIGNAQRIGLLPRFRGVVTRSAGNAAGSGVQRALLDVGEMIRSRELAEGATHVELAMDPIFQEMFLKHLSFDRSNGRHG